MRCLFVNDHTLLRSDDKFYTSGVLNNDAFDWYYQFFDDISVLMNYRDATSIDMERVKPHNLLSAVDLETVPKRWLVSSPREAWEKTRRMIAESDAVIARVPSFLSAVACQHALTHGKPLCVMVASSAWRSLWYHGSISAKLLAPFSHAIARYCIGKSPFAIYASRQYLQKVYPCRGVAIGCSDARIPPVAPGVLARRLQRIADGFDRRPLRLGLIGSLHVDYKGHKTALHALAAIKARIPDFRLLLLGSGDGTRWRQLSERLGIQDNIEYCGTLPPGQPVFEWLDDLDIYLQPSLAEGHGRAAVEAISRGCPIIVAQTGGLVELTEAEWQHRPKDFQGLGELIVKLVHDKQLMREYAERCFARGTEYYQPHLDAIKNEFMAQFAKSVESSG